MIPFSKEDRGTESPRSARIGYSPSLQCGLGFCAEKAECGRSQKPEGESFQNGLSARLNAAERLKV